MTIAICNGSIVAYLLSDAADISQWPHVVDGTYRFTEGLPFEATFVEGVDLPDGTSPHECEYVEGVVTIKAVVAISFTTLKTELANEIENAVMEVRRKPIENAREYESREAEALAFKNANYEGDPGEYVLDFATAAGMTYQMAADRVLLQAEGFRQVEPQLAGLRMKKYAVLRATSEVEARSIHATAMTAINAIGKAIS